MHKIYTLKSGKPVQSKIKKLFGTHGIELLDEDRLDLLKKVNILVDSSTTTQFTESQGTSKSSTGSIVGRALVGAAVSGGLGAVVGGVTGKKSHESSSVTKESKNYELTLELTFLNEKKVHAIVKDIDTYHWLLAFVDMSPWSDAKIKQAEKEAKESRDENIRFFEQRRLIKDYEKQRKLEKRKNTQEIINKCKNFFKSLVGLTNYELKAGMSPHQLKVMNKFIAAEGSPNGNSSKFCGKWSINFLAENLTSNKNKNKAFLKNNSDTNPFSHCLLATEKFCELSYIQKNAAWFKFLNGAQFEYSFGVQDELEYRFFTCCSDIIVWLSCFNEFIEKVYNGLPTYIDAKDQHKVERNIFLETFENNLKNIGKILYYIAWKDNGAYLESFIYLSSGFKKQYSDLPFLRAIFNPVKKRVSRKCKSCNSTQSFVQSKCSNCNIELFRSLLNENDPIIVL
ncbi:hypothetical protein [Litorilituus sediminis]|uniref:Uncharacterized protein n=1 Tax=Litorilituus sediminis TaxID=718192 RepID=A0A4P6P578_9GAMM|nr:hypothetical protein [Litorilituus sediminis]QBG36711.1 hypothetical protein EMK97_13780 [Litorilituus sediminis]